MEKRERRANDYYPTPDWAVISALKMIDINPETILDPGAGKGIWGKYVKRLWYNAQLTGVDIHFEKPELYEFWFKGNFLNFDSWISYDLIIGNPPYGKKKDESGPANKHLAEDFVQKSLTLLNDGGQLGFLLRMSFLESASRQETLWNKPGLKKVGVYVNRIPFYTDEGVNKTDQVSYGFYIWEKGYTGTTELSWIKK